MSACDRNGSTDVSKLATKVDIYIARYGLTIYCLVE